MKLYLAIDQGGHASRALAFNEAGALVAAGHAPVDVLHPQTDYVEHDPHQMLAATRKAIEVAIAALGARARDVVAAGLATQRSTIVCWDRTNGAPLSPVISWQDRRAAHWIDQFRARDDAIHRATGLFVTAHYGVSKLHWCLRRNPAVQLALEQERLAYGPLASFLLFHLARERPLLVDPANASRTLLWNIHTLDWDDELLDLFGLPREPLPRCAPTCFEFGHLDVRGRDVPITVMTGDQSAALYAYGPPQPNVAYVNIGTGAFLQRLSGGNVDYAPKLLTGVVLQCEHNTQYVLEGTVNGAGSALVETERLLGISEAEAEANISRWLDQPDEPPLFLNGVSGLGAPFWLAQFPSRFVGEGGSAQMLVAVVESIVFLLQVNLEEMAGIYVAPQRIVATGGLARLDGLCQRLADVSGLPVYRPAECEATARGTAFLLAGRPQHWPEPGAGTAFTPHAQSGVVDRYARWRREMSAELRRLGRY
jgi:glycerol kinase